MGLTAAEWNQVSEAGVELLGDGWTRIGKGRKLQVLRVPVGWWAQCIYYENSSIGAFVGWGSLLAKPMPNSELGDRGHSFDSIRATLRSEADWEHYRSMIDVGDPVALANFARFVEEDRFAPSRDLDLRVRTAEELFRGWQERWEHHPYYSITRQLYVMPRVLTGARPLAELVEEVRWVVEDDALANGNSKSAEFYPELLTTLEEADRPAMEELLLRMRRENLAELGVPDEFISDVAVPEPKVPW
ncbi:hypothetical protein MUG78_05185 [Gordonia alkaliphila]|uniref:hypothetical protein n=1 Tax=Gordonia alkaliphila TaxID=1053547 RepID=UPI001FF5DB28|nr:hypothetical protein [Gordonia alkaliphila]MCK0438874.1 hypothetical protein [Gordonia alkaliphila]